MSASLLSPRDELLDSKQAAAYLNCQPQTLMLWRCTGRYNLPFVKIGRLARYKRSDLDRFIASRTVGASAE